MKRKWTPVLAALLLALLLGGHASDGKTEMERGCALLENEDEGADMLTIQVGDAVLTAVLERNSSAQALKALLADGPLRIDVQNYGGFEKVGALPQDLPQEDVRTTTAPGDIMLYQGSSIVFFYDSNTWAYTRIGTVVGSDREELERVLGGEEDAMILSLEED